MNEADADGTDLGDIALNLSEADKEKLDVVLLQLTVLVIFGPRGLKGMPKHCIFEHFLQFLNLI